MPLDVVFDDRLSHGARLTYAVLVSQRFKGKPFVIVPLPKIAATLGFAGDSRKKAAYSQRSALRWIEELVATGHVERLPTRKGEKAKYRLTSSDNLVTSRATNCATQVVTPASPGSDTTVTGVVTPLSPYTRRTLTSLSRNVGAAAFPKRDEASDELLTLHQKTTGWSFPVVAKDAAKAIAAVGGKVNEALLVANYRRALKTKGIEKPLAWAIKATKGAAQWQ
jgi:hypothetical protein